ncbi:MAG: pyridoxal-phosphate dependent enzyme [Chitinophagaceae bacterium]|nr:pyridoxal-phosphate dependent enzyme [Chitinophagaceae bacterium]
MLSQLTKPSVDTLQLDILIQKQIRIDVLRLDLIHPTISGNKWYKLQEYLKDAQQLGKSIILSFGGAFSNHIVATAAACSNLGFESIGIIRGEKPQILSVTLKDARKYGMKLFFVSREQYCRKEIPEEVWSYGPNKIYMINEGGYGVKGMHGAARILNEFDTRKYSHICVSVGTGTTLAGLAFASAANQNLIGVSVFKNNLQLKDQVNKLTVRTNFQIIHDYHFGGYARKTGELFEFMNRWFLATKIPTDFVYTGKLFYAVHDLVKNSFFDSGSNILIVHSGGLQGNRSLPVGALIF